MQDHLYGDANVVLADTGLERQTVPEGERVANRLLFEFRAAFQLRRLEN
jgi:hypothetical protein